jgi:hypothetical protein
MKDNLEAVAVSAMAFRLDDLVVGAPDPRGRMVLDILWAVDAFKIYKTSEGLTPFFSDNPKMAVAQRSAYLELGSEISEYNHLIHALRPPVLPFTDGKRAISERDTHTVEHFERELARCIAQAMLGDVPQARVALRRLRRRLGAQISNRGRIVHLCVNLVLVAILVATGLILVRIDYVSPLGYDTREVFTAVMMGGVGALFSTTVRLQNMEIDPTVSSIMHWVYAAQRVMIGALGAFVLYCGFRGGILTGLFGASGSFDATAAFPIAWLTFVSILAGFSERLVPNLLASQVSSAMGSDTEEDAVVEASRPPLPAKDPVEDAPKPKTTTV